MNRRPPFLLKHKDGTILDLDGNELFLGVERFKSLVKDPHRCFLCGAGKATKQFNDEHVVPAWVQRAYGLINKKIRLSNGTKFNYRSYKISCCVDCNSFLGKTFEGPISRALAEGPDAFLEWYRPELFRVFLWVNLIYLKMHLKDNELRLERHQNAPDTRIGDLYDWTELHHCHAMLRAARLGFSIDVEKTIGSVFCLRLGEWAIQQPYDYNDHLPTHTVMIRLGEIAFICVLNDSCGTLQGLEPKLENLPPDLSPLQLLEVLSEFQFISAHLKYRPHYKTEIDPSTGEVIITGQTPKLFDLENLDFSLRGEFMARNIYGSFPGFRIGDLSAEETRRKLLSGDVTFLQTT